MNRRVLVADDSLTIQKVIKLSFARHPLDLVEATTFVEALASATKHQPSLVIIDATLPGMQSVEDFKKLQAQAGGCPLILLLGSYDGVDEKVFRNAGIEHILKKPFDSVFLVSLAENLLGVAAYAASAPPQGAAQRSPGDKPGQNPLAIPGVPPPPISRPAPASFAVGNMPISTNGLPPSSAKAMPVNSQVSQPPQALLGRESLPPPSLQPIKESFTLNLDTETQNRLEFDLSFHTNSGDGNLATFAALSLDDRALDLSQGAVADGSSSDPAVLAAAVLSSLGTSAQAPSASGDGPKLSLVNQLESPASDPWSSGQATRPAPTPEGIGGSQKGAGAPVTRHMPHSSEGSAPMNQLGTATAFELSQALSERTLSERVIEAAVQDEVMSSNTLSQGTLGKISSSPALKLLLDDLARDLPDLVRKIVEEYCDRHFKSIAREFIASELRRLADEKARHLVDN